jgi:uncharacterized membrane protein
MQPQSSLPVSPTQAAQENIRTVAQIQKKAAENRTVGQRLSDRIASVAAREGTIALHAVGFAAWIGLNSRIFPVRPFDPFPFNLLTMSVSLEAIFLTLFVLASQNRMTQDADRRSNLDLQVNLLAEQEMTLVLQMLKELCEHFGLQDTIRSPKFVELAQQTDVEEIAGDLDRSDARHDRVQRPT